MIIKPDIKLDMPRLDILKPPEGFCIVIDTREQIPYFTTYSNIVKQALHSGDYSIKGFEQEIVIERKRIDDLLNCIGNDRERFEKELERMREFRWKGLVIEGTERDLYTSTYSQVKPSSIRWSLCSFEIKYNLHIYFAYDLKSAERWTFDKLYYWYTRRRRGKI